jgi:hypothetical protein
MLPYIIESTLQRVSWILLKAQSGFNIAEVIKNAINLEELL